MCAKIENYETLGNTHFDSINDNVENFKFIIYLDKLVKIIIISQRKVFLKKNKNTKIKHVSQHRSLNPKFQKKKSKKKIHRWNVFSNYNKLLPIRHINYILSNNNEKQ